MTTPMKCTQGLWDGWYRIPCEGKGVRLAPNGLPYCGVHHPDAVARRQAKSDAVHEKEAAGWAQETESRRRAALYPVLLEALREALAIADPERQQTIGRLGGILGRAERKEGLAWQRLLETLAKRSLRRMSG